MKRILFIALFMTLISALTGILIQGCGKSNTTGNTVTFYGAGS